MKTFLALTISLFAIVAHAQTPLPPASVVVKVTEKNTAYWQLSYNLTIRNPSPEAITRDYRINHLDKQGFVLEYSNQNKVVTPAKSTNVVRGVSLITIPKANDYSKTEVVTTVRK